MDEINRNVKVIALDLDGTITQHRSPMVPANRAALDRLREKYRLIMVGAGDCMRIFRQMEGYPVDIIGNYAMQYGTYDPAAKTLSLVFDRHAPVDRASVDARVTALREKHGYTAFKGENVEFHDSGVITIPLLGTKADIADKLAFDPDRRKRRAIYEEVCQTFPEYIVFVGGSSSFDMTPRPYDKRFALQEFCTREGLSPNQIVYVGDDYESGGNDEAVYNSEFRFIIADDYLRFPEIMAQFL